MVLLNLKIISHEVILIDPIVWVDINYNPITDFCTEFEKNIVGIRHKKYPCDR